MRATRLGALAVLVVAGCSHVPAESPSDATVSRPFSDFADGSYHSFDTLDGKIQCRVREGNLVCQTEGRSYTVADTALCGAFPGLEQGNARRFIFSGGSARPCATIIQGEGFDSPHVLAAGETVTAELAPGRTITCAAAEDDLTCTSNGEADARGFRLSVDSFTVL